MKQPTIDVTRSAVLFHNMLNGAIKSSIKDNSKAVAESGFLERCARLQHGARERGIPIFWVRVEHRPDGKDRANVLTDKSLAAGGRQSLPIALPGSAEGANIAGSEIRPEDYDVVKPRFDPFIGTDLEISLRVRGIDTILMAGITAHTGGIESCARGARDRDFNVVVVRDCCFGDVPELHRWSLESVLPYYARVMTSDEVFALLD